MGKVIVPQDIRILLDAGHYGKFNQSPVVPEYWESRRMWILYKYLRGELEKYGFTVSGTRSDPEKDLAVYERGYLAKGCDLFISLHSNAVVVNGGESIDRVDVYAPYDNINNSHDLAARLAASVAELMNVSGGYVKTYKSERGNWEYYGVLRGARAAGCPLYYIIEHSFHTNKAAAQWLLQDANLKRLAAVEAAIIAAHFGIKTKFVSGDVDADGNVNSLDYMLIKRAVMGTYTMTEEQTKRADVNHDGKVDALDYLLTKRIAFGTYNPDDAIFAKGDKVMLNDEATAYVNGDAIDDWVHNVTLYVRDIESDGDVLLVSTEKTKKVYTGRVRASDVHKI